MNKIIYWLLLILCKGNRLKLSASLCLFYYKQMKKYEAPFKNYLSTLLNDAIPCTLTTPFGKVKVCYTKKATVDTDKLLKSIPIEKLISMSNVRVNLVMKYLGDKFDTVVSNWYNEKSVLLK